MSVATPPSGSAPLPVATPTRMSLLRIYMQLTKARLSALVVFTTAAGYVLASNTGLDWGRLAITVLGTALAACCASALNQLWEIRRDAAMMRTSGRPLPCGAMSPKHAFCFAMIVGYAGIGLLAAFVNLAAGGLALLTVLLYVLVYTPLKVRTSLNTIVGAVCGAIPPMIGWVAVTGRIEPGAWLLAALLFVWQLPHFLALAWLYRKDYARGGFVMLPNRDPDGGLTALTSTSGALVLVLIGLVTTLSGLAGWVFAVGAFAAGLWMLGRSIAFMADRTDGRARRLFRASLVYLTIVLGLLVIDRGPVRGLPEMVVAQGTADASFR